MILYNKKIWQNVFLYPKKYWYKNIKYIPTYFSRLHHLIKYGYDRYARYETFDWFIDTMRGILTDYLKYHYGYPIRNWDVPEEDNLEIWEGKIKRMIELLDDMDESNPKYESIEDAESENDYIIRYKNMRDEMNKAKDEFFKIFAECFYDLWD